MRISAVLVAGFLMVGPACGLTVSDTPGAMSGGSEPTAPPPSPGVTPPNPAPAPPGMSPTPTNPPSPGTPPSTPPTPGTPPYPPGTPPSPPGTPPSPPGTPPVPMPPPSPPGASGPGVTINGRFFPKDKVIVFLHLGHSNMAGRTNTPPSMRPLNFETHPRLWAYAKGGAWRRRRSRCRATTSPGAGQVPACRSCGRRWTWRPTPTGLDRPRARRLDRRVLPELPQGRPAVRLRDGTGDRAEGPGHLRRHLHHAGGERVPPGRRQPHPVSRVPGGHRRRHARRPGRSRHPVPDGRLGGGRHRRLRSHARLRHHHQEQMRIAG